MKTSKLTEYIRLLVAKYLNNKYYNIDDCTQDCLLALWNYEPKKPTSWQGSFRSYLERNEIPEGKDRAELKKIVHNTKLRYLYKENRQCPYEVRKILANRKEDNHG